MERRGEEYKERLLDGYWNDLSQGGGHRLREMHLKDTLEEDQEDLIPNLVGEIWSGERNKSQLPRFLTFPILLEYVGATNQDRKSRRTGESESHPVMSDSLQPHGLYSPWNSPGQSTGVGSLSLLQGIFPTRNRTGVSCIAGRFFTNWAIREA